MEGSLSVMQKQAVSLQKSKRIEAANLEKTEHKVVSFRKL